MGINQLHPIFMSRSIRYFFLVMVMSIVGLADAQDPLAPDSLQTLSTADSIRRHIQAIRQHVLADTSQLSASINGVLLDLVNYRADSIYYRVEDQELIMRGNVSLTYQDLKLSAGAMRYLAESETMVAEDEPILFEKNDKLVGREMRYHLRTRQGQVLQGTSQYDTGFFGGREIRKVDEKTLFIRDGYYTTCDAQEPHFHFSSKRMKIILKDKVVVEPVIFYIGRVPVMALPFYVFPLRSGRQSGWLMPRFGRSNRDGYKIEDLGYYWATNDYMDVTARVSIRERTGLKVGGDYRYYWRHHLKGTLSFDYEWSVENENQSSQYWRLIGNHQQTIDDQTTLNANANFVSSKDYYKDTSDYEDNRTQGRLDSYISLDRSMGQARLKMESRFTHNLISDVKTITLPNITFNFTRSDLIPQKKGGLLERFSPRLSFSSGTLLENEYTESGYECETETDSTTVTKEVRKTLNTWNGQQNFSLSFSLNPQLVYWLSPRLSMSLTDTWHVDQAEAWDDTLCTVYKKDKNASNGHRVTPGNIVLSANTNIYGLFQPQIGKLQAVRHTIQPSISMSYNPGFYFQDDDYGLNFKKVNPGTNQDSKFSISSLRLANTFSAKYRTGEKDTGTVQLFTLDFASSYRKTDNEWRFADITGDLKTNISAISLNISTSYDPYDREFGTGTLSSTASFRLSQKKAAAWLEELLHSSADNDSAREATSAAPDTLSPQTETADSLAIDVDNPLLKPPSNFPRPTGSTQAKGSSRDKWSLSLSPSYRRAFELSDRETSSSNEPQFKIRANVRTDLTTNWSLNYHVDYDFSEQKVRSQGLQINRDLHCWEANFTWNSSFSGAWNYYFVVRIKELPDIKVEHKESRY